MACTRFNYDPCRTNKKIQEATDTCRWILNKPGNGPSPDFIEDPYIRIQQWGANLRTHTIDIECELKGINKKLSKDCFPYQTWNVPNHSISYSSNKTLSTQQSRTTNPAWWYKDKEQVHWYYLPLNPQENTCLPFHNNIQTRLIAKDHFLSKKVCL
jgi:hypothetical protein